MIGDAEEEREALTLGDEVDVGHAQESPVPVEGDLAGQEGLTGGVGHLQGARGVEGLLGRGDDFLARDEGAAANAQSDGMAITAHLQVIQRASDFTSPRSTLGW